MDKEEVVPNSSDKKSSSQLVPKRQRIDPLFKKESNKQTSDKIVDLLLKKIEKLEQEKTNQISYKQNISEKPSTSKAEIEVEYCPNNPALFTKKEITLEEALAKIKSATNQDLTEVTSYSQSKQQYK